MTTMARTTETEHLELASQLLREEAEAVAALAELPEGFARAVEMIDACARKDGTVLVTGLGKSGLVGAKISATMASLGIPSHPVHPTEAAHGDLGRFREHDLVLALSFSGSTAEVVALCGLLRQDGLDIITITGRKPADGDQPDPLSRLATVPLYLGLGQEALHPRFSAPTASTTATLALGDALAISAAARRGFSDADFARRHPGGALGGALRPVMDIARCTIHDHLPVARESDTVIEAQQAVQAGGGRRPGALLLVDGDGKLTGIFTDGDLRRLVLRDRGELDQPISNVMTKRPRTISSTALARDAVALVLEHRQDEVPIVDGDGKPVGLLDVQDLVALKLVEG
ncbi:MAG: KpsF/GutQ family sugar-phosphate isomerase [Phycisphaerales bacterium]|nr:KpsF/GutQ family sugar-phosphate isomerase [Phycisphaerales bacterium]